MAKYDYNMISIGAGSAGLVASYIGAAVKAKVAIIEKHKMGGDCLNTGCVPSKALINSAKFISNFAKQNHYGVSDIKYNFDFANAMEQVQEVIKKIEPHDSVERYSKLGVECIEGEAKILSPHEISVNGKTLTTKNIVIATGGKPFMPPIPGLKEVDPLNSDTLWGIRELPKRFLFVGGGPIGCELAQSFQRLGSQVTIVDMADSILTREDEDVKDIVKKSFAKDEVTTIYQAKILRFESSNGQHSMVYEKDGKEQTIEFDRVFMGTGRKANTENLGLDELGVKKNKNGTLQVDDYLRTNIKSIYGCGDVVGPFQFTHMAAHQAWYSSVNALFGLFKKFKVDYSVVPWVTYVDPEIARVGLNELDAKAKGIDYEVTTYGIDDLDRAITDRVDYGIVKVLTVPGKDTILGVTICGDHAGELLAEYTLAMKYKIGLNKILGTIHPYPTMAEANKYAAGEWKRSQVKDWQMNLLEKFHSWRRGA